MTALLLVLGRETNDAIVYAVGAFTVIAAIFAVMGIVEWILEKVLKNDWE